MSLSDIYEIKLKIKAIKSKQSCCTGSGGF